MGRTIIHYGPEQRTGRKWKTYLKVGIAIYIVWVAADFMVSMGVIA